MIIELTSYDSNYCQNAKKFVSITTLKMKATRTKKYAKELILYILYFFRSFLN